MSTRMTGGVLRLRPAGQPYRRRNDVMSHPVKTVAILVARPGRSADLRALLDGMLAPSRAEPGNLRYDLWQDQADPARFVLDELYTGDEAVAAHRASPHFRHYASIINDLADRNAVTLDPVAVA
jgi:quinol monooxygenase YgiN